MENFINPEFLSKFNQQNIYDFNKENNLPKPDYNWKTMKEIFIDELDINSKYNNSYIILEVNSEIIKMKSMQFESKDTKQKTVHVEIYNTTDNYTPFDSKKLSEIYKRGMPFIIIEPYYKNFTFGGSGIRVDDPDKLIFFNNKKELEEFLSKRTGRINIDKNKIEKMDKKELYQNAENLYKEKKYEFALMFFETLINKKDLNDFLINNNDNKDNIQLKISFCYFNLKLYRYAINNFNLLSKEYLHSDLNKSEIIKNKILSYIGMRNTESLNLALDILNNSKKLFENLNKLSFYKLLLSSLNKKLDQAKGIFDFLELRKKAEKNFELEIVNYINPKLEIGQNEKGISIITKENLTKGEILVVSPPIVSIPFYKNNNSQNYNTRQDTINAISEKILKYPLEFPDFYKLYDGKNKDLNLSEREKLKSVNLEKIEVVEKLNGFVTGECISRNVARGLWYYPSLFNHSCCSNATTLGIGNILVILVVKNIEKNSEVTVNYYANENSYKDRQEFILSHFDFKCECELCKDEEYKINNLKEKKILVDYMNQLDENIYDVFAYFSRNKIDIDNIINFIRNNESKFSWYEISNAYLKIASYIKRNENKKAIEYYQKCYDYGCNRDYILELRSLASIYAITKEENMTKKCEEVKELFIKSYKSYFPTQGKYADFAIEKILGELCYSF